MTIDPVKWSVDEVVSFLCDPTDTPWLPSPTSPRPDSIELEAALRANDVCGEILLALNVESFKELGIGSLGKRITLMSAVKWLESRRVKKIDEEPVSHPPHVPQTNITDAIHSEHHDKPPKEIPRRVVPTRVTEAQPDASIANITDATHSEHHDKPPKKIPRRVIPTRVTEAQPDASMANVADAIHSEHHDKPPKKIPRRVVLTKVTEAQPDASMANIVDQDSDQLRKLTRQGEDLDSFLQRWPPEDIDGDSPNLGLPLYGESDSEEELDPETWKEVLDENPDLRSAFVGPDPEPTGDSRVLSREMHKSIIDTYIMNQGYEWRQKNLESFSSQLDPLWSDLRASGKIDAKKAEFESSIAEFEARLEKFTKALHDGKFNSAKQLEKNCGSLDPTISNLSEVRWALELMSTDDLPSKVASAHLEEALEPPQPNDFEGDEDSNEEADTDSDEGESLDSELENEPPVHEFVNTGPYDMGPNLHPQPTTETTNMGQNLHPQPATETAESTTSESSDLAAAKDLFEKLEGKSSASLEREQDKHAILAKHIMELEEKEIEEIATLVNNRIPLDFVDKARQGLRTMMDRRQEFTSTDPDNPLFMRVSALYLAWHTCHVISADGIDKNLIWDTLATLKRDKEPTAFFEFLTNLTTLIKAHKIWSGERPRGSSQNASSTQSEANSHPLIISSKDPQAPILLNSEITQYIKPHQLEGIQFMWRELCESQMPQGCLLAHEMGLGKTMQV